MPASTARGCHSVGVERKPSSGRPGVGEPKSDAGRRTMALPRWLVEELAAMLATRGITAADGEALVSWHREA